MMSALKQERLAASAVLPVPRARFTGDRTAFVENIRQALYASKICSYAQGFQLLRAADEEYQWELQFGTIASLWRAGCIIRAQFLAKIKEAYEQDPALPNLLLDPYFSRGHRHEPSPAGARSSPTAVELGIPVPAFSQRAGLLRQLPVGGPAGEPSAGPARLLRGAHLPADGPGRDVFHTEWE